MTEATVKQGRKVSGIWLVPIVAAVLGIGMVVYNYLSQGPEVTISFKTATGIEAGKTKIKTLNVELGVVESVELSEDLNGVVVKATLEPFARPMLREDTQFWVERPRIGPGGVSGLGTILSGGFIQLDAGSGDQGRRDFTGLENPPLTPAGTPGLELTLTSKVAGDVSAGDPVLYRGYQVGQVETSRFDPDTTEIHYSIFIDEPYENLVSNNTRFWNASGISLKASAQGLEVDVGSLQSLLTGGVAFDLPAGKGPGEQAQDGDSFILLASRQNLNDKVYDYGLDVVVAFEQSVSGLIPGAPVEYRGIQIGIVKRLMILELMGNDMKKIGRRTADSYGEPIPVLVRIEPGRLGLPDSQEIIDAFARDINGGVKYGLRAELKTGNLLTGQLLVSFDYFPNAEPAEVTEFAGYMQLPTVAGGFGQIQTQISQLLDKLNGLPLDPVVRDLDSTLVSLRGLLDSLQGLPADQQDAVAVGSIGATLRDLNATLDSFSPDSDSGAQLGSSLRELNQTLQSLDGLVKQLSDKPNSIIFSPPVVEDPVPQKGTTR